MVAQKQLVGVTNDGGRDVVGNFIDRQAAVRCDSRRLQRYNK